MLYAAHHRGSFPLSPPWFLSSDCGLVTKVLGNQFIRGLRVGLKLRFTSVWVKSLPWNACVNRWPKLFWEVL